MTRYLAMLARLLVLGGAVSCAPIAVPLEPLPSSTPPPCSADTPTASTATCSTACAYGSAAACAILSDRLDLGDRVRADPREALADARRACHLGSPIGCIEAAEIYSGGFDGSDRELADAVEAERYRRRVPPLALHDCDLGDADACDEFARWMPPDPARSLRFTTRARGLRRSACGAGNGRACAGLADAIDRVDHPEAARSLYAHACDLRYPPSCSEAGYLMPTNDRERARLLRQGCQLGWGRSCYQLASTELGHADHAALYKRGCALDDADSCERAGRELPRVEHDEARRLLAHGCALRPADCVRGQPDPMSSMTSSNRP